MHKKSECMYKYTYVLFFFLVWVCFIHEGYNWYNSYSSDLAFIFIGQQQDQIIYRDWNSKMNLVSQWIFMIFVIKE